MKILLLCKSDTTGGAAVVTLRLMNALRRRGIDARMLVARKGSDSPYVAEAASPWRTKIPFILERLRIFMANGFNRRTLFMADTGGDGLPLHRHPWVKEADVVCLNWINQGFLSLREIYRLRKSGKKIIWTMHDMWNMTGMCHHADTCPRFKSPEGECGNCPMMGKRSSSSDLSHRIWKKKKALYSGCPITFVAVSGWLRQMAQKSSLMSESDIRVIPNPFPIGETASRPRRDDGKIRIVFGAARLDDPVKGLPVLVEATRILSSKYPEESRNMELVTFGGLKNPEALSGIAIPLHNHGMVPPDRIRDIYASADIVVSTSRWETLPGTLVEGQAWGCVPVCLDHGGQSDIVSHKSTGWLAPWAESDEENALSIAEGIIWASRAGSDVRDRMLENVRERFSEEAVADRYISLFREITS